MVRNRKITLCTFLANSMDCGIVYALSHVEKWKSLANRCGDAVLKITADTILAVIGILTLASGFLLFLWRTGRGWGKLEDRLENLTTQFGEYVKNQQTQFDTYVTDQKDAYQRVLEEMGKLNDRMWEMVKK